MVLYRKIYYLFNKTKVLRVFEAFAGIGAQHKALKNIRKKYKYEFEIVATSEWDVFANISYNAIHHSKDTNKNQIDINEIENFLNKFTHSLNGKDPVKNINEKIDNQRKIELFNAIKNSNNLGSITKIKGKELIDKTKGFDLLTYSFPCQDLSMAGGFHKKSGGMKKGSGTRSGLLWEIERILLELKVLKKLPKFLLLENVNAMLNKKNKPDYDMWINSLKKMNYSTKTIKLDSQNFGSPQKRKRVYAISVLDYKGKVDEIGNILDIDIESNLFKSRSVNEFLKMDYSNEIYRKEALESQPNRTPSREKMFKENLKLNQNNQKFCSTITTKQDRNPNAGVIDLKGTILGDDNRDKKEDNQYKKANYRLLTNREAYLLMGFTEKDFEKIKNLNIRKDKMYQQAGNSIVVNVLEALMLKIQELFNESEKK